MRRPSQTSVVWTLASLPLLLTLCGPLLLRCSSPETAASLSWLGDTQWQGGRDPWGQEWALRRGSELVAKPRTCVTYDYGSDELFYPYSHGPNGVDDLGARDDVFLPWEVGQSSIPARIWAYRCFYVLVLPLLVAWWLRGPGTKTEGVLAWRVGFGAAQTALPACVFFLVGVWVVLPASIPSNCWEWPSELQPDWLLLPAPIAAAGALSALWFAAALARLSRPASA